MANPSSVPHPSASAGPIGLAAANNAGSYIIYKAFSPSAFGTVLLTIDVPHCRLI